MDLHPSRQAGFPSSITHRNMVGYLKNPSESHCVSVTPFMPDKAGSASPARRRKQRRRDNRLQIKGMAGSGTRWRQARTAIHGGLSRAAIGAGA
jgi:hypothetical protein